MRTVEKTLVVDAHGRVNDPMAKLQFLRVGWGGVGMMTFFELEHMLDATQLCLSCHCTHAGCYATVFVLSLHTCWMLRNCVCLVIALGKLAHKANNARRWWKTTSFFRRMVPIRTNSKQNAFVKTRTHGKNGTKWTYEPTDHKWKSTPLQHFVHLQQNGMWISPRVAITAVTLLMVVV